MNTFSHVPPGFRFHPTDEELVDYYLRKKVTSRKIDFDVIRELDLYKIEPWDLQERCRIGVEEQNEWYFFSHKDKKYPTGTRTNRATTAGFWKATGRDKPIYSRHALVGMRKTLVYYKGRAPNGQKSDWIMHEYRLETNENGTAQEEGWVVCRVFRKRVTALRRDHESPCWYDEQLPFFPDLESPNRPISHADMITYQQHPYSCKQEMELHYSFPNHHFLQLPHLESPKLPNHISQGSAQLSCPLTLEDSIQPFYQHRTIPLYNCNSKVEESVEQVTDWRVLDKFVASQLSQDDAPKEPGFPNAANDFQVPYKPGTLADLASTSASSCQVDLWK